MTNERHEKALEAAEPEWIEHDGQGMPVDGNAMVTVRFRDWAEDSEPTKASYWDNEQTRFSNWFHYGPRRHPSEIIAYRIHTPNHFTNGE